MPVIFDGTIPPAIETTSGPGPAPHPALPGEADLATIRRVVAYTVANLRLPPHVDLDDLEQDAIEAVLRAWPRYDPAKSNVATFTGYRAKGAITDTLRRDRPGSQRGGMVQLGQQGRHPVRASVELVSLSQPAGDREHRDTLGDRLPALEPPEPDVDTCRALDAAVGRLPHRRRFAVRARYWADLRNGEIGELLGVSESRVAQLHTKALAALRDDPDVKALAA